MSAAHIRQDGPHRGVELFAQGPVAQQVVKLILGQDLKARVVGVGGREVGLAVVHAHHVWVHGESTLLRGDETKQLYISFCCLCLQRIQSDEI